MQKMISAMARMYPMFLMAGLVIVVIGFIIGIGNSSNAAQYFSFDKVTRETTQMDLRAGIEATGIWLPTFKFLGVGLILGGIVMALRVIIDRLQEVSQQVMGNLPEGKRPPMPAAPWYGPTTPITMMLGEVVFVAALIVGLSTAGVAREVFANAIPDIDAATSGSVLLGQLEQIKTTVAWLVPFKFLGIALEFTAIVQGLATIIFILTNQTQLLDKGIQTARQS